MSQATPRASSSTAATGRTSFESSGRGGYADDALGYDFLLGPAPNGSGRRPERNSTGSAQHDSRSRTFSPVRGQQNRSGLTYTFEEHEYGYVDRRSSDDSSTPGSYDAHNGHFYGHQAAAGRNSGSAPERFSSASVASSNGATSPLSPHVEPFSPTTSVSGSLPWAQKSESSSSSDLRTVTSSAPFSQRSANAYSDAPQAAFERRLSAFTLDDPTPAPAPNQFSVLASASFEDVSAGSFSTNMSASGSRDALPQRRELQADRGGYVRANYSSEAASRSYAVPSTSQNDFPVEEISTIFVVGFPDDMLEREFQNMFLFVEGFEAATLKVPASTYVAREQRDRDRAGLDPYGDMIGDAAFDDEVPGSVPFETTLPPLLGPNHSRDRTASPAPNSRKQTIGFARFRTRAQAQQARDVLSGRKVDAERGSVLKAEMAKKNLHTKRSLEGASSSTAAVYPLDSAASSTRSSGAAAPVPSALSPEHARQMPNDRDARPSYETVSSAPVRQGERGSFQEASSREHWDAQQQSRTAVSPALAQAAYGAFPRERNERSSFEQSQSPALSPTMSHAFPQAGRTSNPATQPPFDLMPNRSMMQQLDESSPSPTFAAPTSSQIGSEALDERAQPYGSFAGPSAPSAGGRQPLYPASAYATAMPPLTSSGIPRTTNPADMNAPKNTLYVGGLPSVLPSLTGPFSAAHLEDSLRNAFARCQGFKRLCFRSKSNGPIVFVEFEDVAYATRALQDMYGHTLGGLVKGGIRLSYSKNPLGVRSSASPPQQHSSPMPASGQYPSDAHGSQFVYGKAGSVAQQLQQQQPQAQPQLQQHAQLSQQQQSHLQQNQHQHQHQHQRQMVNANGANHQYGFSPFA